MLEHGTPHKTNFLLGPNPIIIFPYHKEMTQQKIPLEMNCLYTVYTVNCL